jgi:hypothetical protein
MEEKYASFPEVCPCAWYRGWRTGSEKLQERQKIIYTIGYKMPLLWVMQRENKECCTYLCRCYLLGREFASSDTKLHTKIGKMHVFS